MKLTDTEVEKLEPMDERYDERIGDGSGLAVRVFPSGQKSWILFYDFEGRRRRMTLGRFTSMKSRAVKKALIRAKALLAEGKDPGAKKIAEERQRREDPLVRDLIEEYLASRRVKKLAPTTQREYARSLRRDVQPRWGSKKVRDITRWHVRRLVDKMVDRGANVGAKRTYAHVRALLNFAIDEEYIEVNPCARLRLDIDERPRERVLNPDEIKAFWYGLDECAMDEAIKLALRFQLVTAQRKGEIVKARWEHVDIKERMWTIPSEISKNRRLHRVPLSDLAVEILQQLRFLDTGSGWLIPSTSKPGVHVRPDSVNQALYDNREVFDIKERFTPHDLRRTAATMIASSGAQREYITKILNHTDRSVTGIYDRYEGDREKREFLNRWAARLEGILQRNSSEAGKEVSFDG